MRDAYLEEGMRVVLEKLGLELDTPYSIEPVHANLWLSAAYRVRVETSNVSLFLKRFPEDGSLRDFFQSPIFFANEAAAYSHVLAEFERFQSRRGLADPVVLAPRCLYSLCDGRHDVIILEDLTAHGYSTPDRKQQLCPQRLSLLVAALGKLHALSLAMKQQEPERFRELATRVQETVFSSEHFTKTSGCLFSKFGLRCHDTLRDQLELEISRRLEPLSSRTGTVLQQLAATDPQNEPWNVLTHGDLWVSNILLSADSSRLRFVDFQQCRYGSPALDVSSVLFLCMDGPTRANYTEHVLRVYHESLRVFLKELGSDPDMFPFEELQRQLIKYGRYGLGIGFLNIPHSFNKRDDEDLQTDSETTAADAVEKEFDLYGKECRQRLLDNIKDAAAWGYL